MQIDKTWGIDLVPRHMKYKPWLINKKGEYIIPNDDEIKETYSISGEVFNENLLYFEECGGNTEKLIKFLNQHVISNKFFIKRNNLLDKSRWYTNEYYFYFIIFLKKVIGRYDFHFGENNNEPLSIYHKIYEQGFINYVPWGKDENGIEVHEITSLNLYFCLLILENIFKIDSDEFIGFLNAVLPKKYEINKNFINNESIWCSLEFIDYAFEFLKIITNSSSSLDNGMYQISVNKLKIPRVLLALNKKLFFKNFLNLFKRWNDIAIINITYKNNKFTLIMNPKEQLFFKKYRKYFKASLLNATKVIIGLAKIVLHIIFNKKDIKDFDININFNINNPEIAIYKKVNSKNNLIFLFIPLLIIFLSIFLSICFYIYRDNLFFLILLPCILSSLGIFTFITVNKKKELDKKIETNYKAALGQIEILENTTKELIEEKNSLEEKVKQRTEDLSEANEKLRKLDKAKNNFFANISHELRTPLTLIIGPIKSILSGDLGEKIERKNKIFTIIFNNTNRLLKLINGILDFAKIDADKMNIKKQKTNIDNLLKYYISSINPALKHKNIQLIFNNRLNGLNASIDQDLFEIVIFNILSNAFKFTRPGGKIIIDLDKDNKKNFIISISDTGIGIPENRIDKIFDRFVQDDESTSRNHAGTGIGLSLIKEIIKIHEGEIKVKSKLGKGTTFTIKLPIDYIGEDNKKVEFSDIKQELLTDFNISEQNNEIEKYDKNRKNILIIEDNIDMLYFLKSTLNKNYNIFTATNGKDALTKINKGPKQDLIISDIMMPKMDGKTFLYELKNLENHKNIPFIFLTARNDTKEKIEGLKDGAVDYIYKPFNKYELMAKINSLLLSYDGIKVSIKEKLVNAIYDKEDSKKTENLNIFQLSKRMKISDREMDIITLLKEGHEYKEIGNLLNISANTVSNHIQNIYKKFNVNNKINLINEIKKHFN